VIAWWRRLRERCATCSRVSLGAGILLLTLLIGGSLLGIVGMLLAVPVAAVIGVLLGFAVIRYKESPYYDDSKTAKKSK